MSAQEQALRAETPSDLQGAKVSTIEPAVRPQAGVYIGIFLTAAAVILFELALTRVFSVMLWAHLAFMVVGSALFGFGVSGVYLALRRSASQIPVRAQLTSLSLFLALAIIGCYVIVTKVPFQMWKFSEDPMNFLYLGVWYVSLIVPFFFAGLIIAKILSIYRNHSSKLYGVDLIGAAVGALCLIPIIPRFGAEGCVVAAALLAAAAGLFYCPSSFRRLRAATLLTIVVLGLILPKASEVVPITLHETKRRFNVALAHNHIYDTRWSPISRVDIAYHNNDTFDIWIDGGTNESAIIRWSGNLEDLKPLRWSTIGTVYDLKQGTEPRAMVIGSSGGREVLFALSHGAAHVDAVEMDPSITALVNEEKYAKFMGRLYQHPKVALINDEGRSFVRRQPEEHYDIIQSVNNYTPVALSSGALNLSAAFLLTKESLNDYLDHLTPNGVLAFHRGATLRMAIMAMEVLAERGVEDPAAHIVITAGEVPFFEGFFLKKSPWIKAEVERISRFLDGRALEHGKKFLWHPFARNDHGIYSTVMNTPVEKLDSFYSSLGVKLYPPTDNRPFMEHFLYFGKQNLSPNVPAEFRYREKQKWRGIIPRGDFPYVAILAESALLALLFIGAPLLLRARSSITHPYFKGFLAYFSCLGFGFIVIEICLMKRYVLFLGNPAYSITTVLVVLLCGAGLGSMVSSRLAGSRPGRALRRIILTLVGFVLLETLLAPLVFAAFLSQPFAARIAISALLLMPLGFLLGMPFPIGLRLINETTEGEQERQRITAWAWGMNGYWTVIGSAATVFIAVLGGFKSALLIATAAYLVGLLSIRNVIRTRT